MSHPSVASSGHRVPRSIAYLSHKGGTAKTTSVQQCAAACASVGARVLVVDGDSQANATVGLGVEPGTAEDRSGLLAAIETGDPDVAAALVRPSTWNGEKSIASAGGSIHVIPSVQGPDGGRSANRRVWLALDQDPTRLGAALAPVADRFDVVLFDLPPEISPIVTAAVVAAQGLAITVQPESSAEAGLGPLAAALADISSEFGGNVAQILGIVVTQYDSRETEHRYRLERIREQFGDLVLSPEVPRRAAVAAASGYYAPTTDFSARSRSVASVYAQITQRLLRRLQDPVLAQFINPLAQRWRLPVEDLLADDAAAIAAARQEADLAHPAAPTPVSDADAV